METYKDTNFSDIVQFLSDTILSKLQEGKKVLWLVTGGSSIPLAVEASHVIGSLPHQKLVVTLTDERYGDIGHDNSNWDKLITSGFTLSEAHLIPILCGESMEKTIDNFNTILEQELKAADYRIGLFGIGTDGHTAGILPKSVAVSSKKLVYGYSSDDFDRITMTPKAIRMLDEAIVFMQGHQKSQIFHDLKKDVIITEQPAHVLKFVPKLSIFYNSK